MRKVAAIAILTVRRAVRSHAVQSLLVLVLLMIIAIPLAIKGDGTLRSQVQISLQYTLSIATLLLAAATVVAGCTAGASDLEERQVFLLVTKPIGSGHIWLGKWLGLLAMNGCLLVATGIGVYAGMKFTIRPSRLDANDRQLLKEEVLTARRAILPDISGSATPSMGMLAVEPQSTKRWTFRLPRALAAEEFLSVGYRFSSSHRLDVEPVAIEWTAGSGNRTGGFRYALKVFAGRPNSLAVPAAAVGNDNTLTIDFFNAQLSPPTTLMFDGNKGVIVYQREGSFEANLIRALLVMFCRLAALAALGLTAGCLFSSPIASFASFAVIVMVAFSGFIAKAAASPSMRIYQPLESAPGLDMALKLFFKIMNAIVGPLGGFDAISLLPRGEVISWMFVLKSFIVFVVAYSGCLGLLGTFVFNRREVGSAS